MVLKAHTPKPYPEVPKTIGDHVKRRRCELGVLQRELADLLRVSEFTVINWEANRCSPNLRVLPRIISFLGYSPFPEGDSSSERLVARRRALGLSRREVAQRLGVDPATLGRWERGVREPRGKYLALVERFVGDLRIGG